MIPCRIHRPGLAASLVIGVLLPGCDEHDRPVAPWFTDATRDAGIDFIHESGGTGGFLMPEIMGAGNALLDFDGDGDLDLYLVNGHGDPASGGGGGDDPSVTNHLLRQDPGGAFTDVTATSGLGDHGYGMGAAVGDIDNDGDPDVYVSNLGADRLYRNDGGTFTDITDAAGIDVPNWSCSAVFLDYDDDGWLDLFVTQYVAFDPRRKCFDRAGRPDYCGPKSFPALPDVLLHNNGDGTFTDVSTRSGIGSLAAAGLGVVAEDFDDDGRVDVYVANDAYPNHLWLNRGDGSFRDEAIARGCAYNLHGQAEAGMGVVAADLMGHGDADLFVTHLGLESNTLYRDLGRGAAFVDDTGVSGLGASSLRWTGFGTAAFDVELDGDLDLAVANGRVNRGDPLPGATGGELWSMFMEPNLFYLNDGAGHFETADALAPALCSALEITRAMSIGDVDGDGDVDLLLSNVEGPARLLLNVAPRAGHWLAVRAVDPDLGRDAIGARVEVTCGPSTQRRTISAGGSYLSSKEPVAHFGLGAATAVDTLTVRWPGGARETFPVAGVDRVITVTRGRGGTS